MCGVAGLIDLNKDQSQNLNKIQFLVDRMERRGPDSKGIFESADKKVILGHTRLAIIDLSVNGHQPMESKSKRFCISFNGEIYNHIDLRKRYLKDHTFRGNSDTETILELVEKLGFYKAVKELEGMFAFFIIDNKENKFYVTRDRIGEKPLSYFITDKSFIFCSQASDLHKIIPDNYKGFNFEAINSFLSFGFIPSPQSIFQNIHKLDPGNVLEGTIRGGSLFHHLKPFWSVKQDYSNKEKIKEYDAAFLEEKLEKVIAQELVSDRKIGAFLSGGLDSSLICSIAKKIDSNINTLSLGFENESYSELKQSRAISKVLKTNHTEIMFTEKNLIEIIPILGEVYDEPFADQSQIPTLLLCKLAREDENIVCLTGDGGDELFGGYNRYKYFNYLSKFKLFLSLLNLNKKNNYFWKSNNRILNDYFRWINQAIGSSKSSTLESTYLSLLNRTYNQPKYICKHQERLMSLKEDENNIQSLMNFDLNFYISNDVLVKTDRASMYYGLELRAPFLNPEIVDYSSCLPINKKVTSRKSKIILTDILKKHLPASLLGNRKKGFDVPLSNWLRGDLKDWVYAVSSDSSSSATESLDAEYRSLIDEHMIGIHNHTDHIWPYLMLKEWMRCQI
tara:strand:+ start:78 stop:1940 length:1863 start_codon:yes stop_codon:yes gene_type:complete